MGQRQGQNEGEKEEEEQDEEETEENKEGSSDEKQVAPASLPRTESVTPAHRMLSCSSCSLCCV